MARLLPSRARLPRRTVRLRLTAWYGGLFLVSGSLLLAATYGLVVTAFVGSPGRNATCQAPSIGCRVIPASQQRAIALQEHGAVLHQLLIGSVLALAVMLLISVAVGWIVAGRVLRPLRVITAKVREISATSLSERLDLAGPDDELKELGDTFDQLLERLEASFRDQRQFVANAAHELRTPLARQRVISQVAMADPDATIDSLRAAHERVLASGADHQRLIDALLLLARGQAGLSGHEHFDLAEVARHVLAGHQGEADDRGVIVQACLGQAVVSGSRQLAGQLTANVITNAIRHNLPEGGQVEVVTRSHEGRAVLVVTNSGAEILEGSVEQLFQPFRTRAADRTGHGEGIGLGLAIVRAISDAHGARLTATPRPGGGLRIEVAFPLPEANEALPG